MNLTIPHFDTSETSSRRHL